LAEKNNIPTVLVAPLDWGLGHTTRCIPVIRSLLQNECRVLVAGEGPALFLLQQEFPGIQTIPLKGYRIRYSRYKRLLPVKILWQLPKILAAVRYEHNWLHHIIIKEHINLVIADNRYGLWTRQVPCVFITHQLTIQTPFGWLTNLVQRLNYRYINRFSACWVPDTTGEANMAGVLSHPSRFPRVPLQYLGPLSRLKAVAAAAPLYRWMMILSGPEPQRTLLEQQLVQLAAQLQGPVLLVRGKPGSTDRLDAPRHCRVVNHLSSAEMEAAFAASEYVVSRSGYTTVMELLSLQKKSLLIPTPGQTEQEYLAQHLMRLHWCYSCTQQQLSAEHFSTAAAFPYRLPSFSSNQLNAVIATTLQQYVHAKEET
jgi:UDP-N-acetylglucosamine transferase subunit ALG13